MEKTLLAVKVETASKGKGHWLKITGEDNKTQNIFPSCPGYNLIAQGKMLKLTIEKNEDSGYWDVVKVEEAPGVSQAPATPPPIPQDNNGRIQHPVTNGDNKDRCVALSYANSLVANGIININDVFNCALTYEKYMKKEFNPTCKDDWMAKYLPESKLVKAVKGRIDPDAKPE